MEALLSRLHALEIIVLTFLKIRPRVFTGELLLLSISAYLMLGIVICASDMS